MTSNWKWKALGTLSLLLISLYILVPSFFDLQSRTGKGKGASAELLKFFPKRALNLGLDLRGGLYLEMDVDLADSLKKRVDVLATEIERSLDKEAAPQVKISRMEENNHIWVELPASLKPDFVKNVRSQFGDALQLVEAKEGAEETPAAGGLEFKLNPQFETKLMSSTLAQAEEAVRNRIDRYGVAEASLERQGDSRLIVELPGIQDAERVIDVIRKTGMLEFRLVDDSKPHSELPNLVKDARVQNQIPEGYSGNIIAKINQALVGKIPAESEVVFELQRDPATRQVVNGVPYLVQKRTTVTGDMLQDARVSVSENEPHVSLTFNNIGSRNFGDLTKENVKKRLAILLDGVLVTAPTINEPILSGQAQITLGFGSYKNLLKEAEDLSLVLREGALPANLTIVNKTVVGPSLGQDSIRKGLNSLMVAGAVILIFMLLYYRWGGLVANVALILNVVLIFAVMALLQASLSLPGLAGIVLTMGMAVDANIIIFERMREERRLGKTAKAIVESGYENAMSAIVDGNVTTLISGIVLYQFGTGPIKGFATTLVIGIVTTMFTAIVVTRLVYDYFIYRKKIKTISI